VMAGFQQKMAPSRAHQGEEVNLQVGPSNL
jgi:hypothetical protein